MLETLNRTFGIENRVSFQRGPGGFLVAELRHRNRSVVTATLYGGHVLSWRDRLGRDRLFLSRKAVFVEGKAIRGGIPIIFPQFGPGPLPSHGFARTQTWQCVESKELADGALSIKLRLTNSPVTETIWPHQFLVHLEIVLHDTLTLCMQVENIGPTVFTFQSALHTYFPVSDIATVSIFGLEGLTYLDNLKNRQASAETSSRVVVSQEVDRVYLQVPDSLQIEDSTSGRTIQITKSGFTDAVVWNPWIEKSKTISDLDPEEYKSFLCVETGNIGSEIRLLPGEMAECQKVIG